MNWNSTPNQNLIQAFLGIENEPEARAFLRDLMTEAEIIEFSKRLQAADMLRQKISYKKIEKETGLSSTTIARVSKWLTQGKDGYKTILNKLHHHTQSELQRGMS